ncbi:hypothetical protein PENSPDRAFT_679436 [Peniophora sp. CONT]|nr:hypothetical protein PENSPDRAFT_679436 [Peniophora sp. CONT]
MADARALLKAKRAETRISHPYASYTSSNQLRCTICSTSVKHASAWEGHLGSKAHRTNVMKAKEAERRKVQEEEEARRMQEKLGDKRRAGSEEDEEGRGKRMRTDDEDEGEANGEGGGFPADFFSDPTRVVPEGGEDEDEDTEMADASAPVPAPAAAPQPQSVLDDEWAAFQQTVLQPAQSSENNTQQDTFARATVFAEPQLVTDSTQSGFPAEPEPEPELTEEQQANKERQRKEVEDRELIMDRLLEEERAQEEADERVSALKGRLEMLKRQRAAAKAKKTGK